MKHYVKHIFCLSFIALVILIGACKKDKSNLSHNTVDDRRDSVTGIYYCEYHYYTHSYVSGPTYDTITLYDTLTVSKSQAPGSIIINGNNFYSPDTIFTHDSASYGIWAYTGTHQQSYGPYDFARFSISDDSIYVLTSWISGTNGMSESYYTGRKAH